MAIDLDLTKYTDRELIDLNHQIVAYLKAKRRFETDQELARFVPGERVWFESGDGRRVGGVVVRVNRKTLSIHADDHVDWNVSPHLVKKQQLDPASPSNVFELVRR